MATTSKRILLVGHCGVDGPRLQREIAARLRDAESLRINSMEDLCNACEEGADLLLVNREPVGFSPQLGLDLIRELKQQYPDQKLMLVSDFPEAQKEAESAGALPGFGKADLDSPKFEKTLRRALSS